MVAYEHFRPLGTGVAPTTTAYFPPHAAPREWEIKLQTAPLEAKPCVYIGRLHPASSRELPRLAFHRRIVGP